MVGPEDGVNAEGDPDDTMLGVETEVEDDEDGDDGETLAFAEAPNEITLNTPHININIQSVDLTTPQLLSASFIYFKHIRAELEGKSIKDNMFG